MKYEYTIENSLLKLSFSGDLIGEHNGPQLVELVNGILHEGKAKNCLIDISAVRYINSSGIGVLITLLTKFRNKGGDLYLINPSDHVRKLLIITKLEAIFNITQSAEEATSRISTKN